ncbi:MAG: hypothetical protein KL863_07530 [Rhizobium sp.]|nr:hypothetical protein [Rhizobium sp.]
MENELRSVLVNLAKLYADAVHCGLSTVSRRAKNDAAFFKRIGQKENTFTLRTYDEVMTWFASNWPTGRQIPLELLQWMSETGFERENVKQVPSEDEEEARQ